MEWEMAAATTIDYRNATIQTKRESEEGERREGMGDEVLCVKVMTDEQIEILRRQISVYATICEQLVEIHMAIAAHQDSLSGMRLGSLYTDPLMTTATARPRWTPTPMQLQILESLYDRGNRTLGKQKIKGIALELSQYGQISESNVYNWFQNRKARSKRKQAVTLPNNTESEAEADVESPDGKKSKLGKTHPHEKLPPRVDVISIDSTSTETNTEVHSLDEVVKRAQRMLIPNDVPKSSADLGQMPFYGNDLSNQRTKQLTREMKIPGSFSTFHARESYNAIGRHFV